MGLCGGWGTPGDTVHLLGRTNAFALKSTLVPSQACLLLSPHRALEHPCTPWDPVLQVHQHLVSLDKAGTARVLPPSPNTHRRIPVSGMSAASHRLSGTNCQFRKKVGGRCPSAGLALAEKKLQARLFSFFLLPHPFSNMQASEMY